MIVFKPGLSNITKKIKRKIKIFRDAKLPEIKISDSFGEDLISTMEAYPDFTWFFVKPYWEELFLFFRKHISCTITDFNMRIILVMAHSFTIILITRLFPPVLTFPFVIWDLYMSIQNSMGWIMIVYVIADLGWWVIRGRRKIDIFETPVARTQHSPWYTKDLNGLILVFLILCIGGYAIGAFTTEVMYLALIVITTLIMATVFPTTGSNSSVNAMVLLGMVLIIVLTITGTGEALLKEAARFIGKSIGERKFVSEPEIVQTRTAWKDLFDAIGDWSMPWVKKEINYSLTNLQSLVMYLMGAAFCIAIAIGNVLGPGECITTASDIQNKASEKSRNRRGINAIISSRWTKVVIIGMILTFNYGDMQATLLNVMAIAPAMAYYWFFERKLWIGMGEFVSVAKGRDDTDMIRGDGPAKRL